MRSHLPLLSLLAVAACGGSGASPTAADDVRTLNALSQQVASAATGYGTQAAMMMDVAACNAAEGDYDHQARPPIQEMVGMGPVMDGRMAAMGHAADADMACGADAMMAALDQHQADACASMSDMAPNKDEAAEHVAAMTAWADHQLVRSHAMGVDMGMGMGGMGGGAMSTGHCVHHPDGSYSLE